MKALMMSSAVILSKEERQMATNLYIRMILDLMQITTENVIFFVKTNQKCGKLMFLSTYKGASTDFHQKCISVSRGFILYLLEMRNRGNLVHLVLV